MPAQKLRHPPFSEDTFSVKSGRKELIVGRGGGNCSGKPLPIKSKA
jgi:hypothetical protein